MADFDNALFVNSNFPPRSSLIKYTKISRVARLTTYRVGFNVKVHYLSKHQFSFAKESVYHYKYVPASYLVNITRT
ncbi:hypothetical protein PGB90_001059 [Kerria lacca]